MIIVIIYICYYIKVDIVIIQLLSIELNILLFFQKNYFVL